MQVWSGNLRHEIIMMREGPDPFQKRQQQRGTIGSVPPAVAARCSGYCSRDGSFKVGKFLSCFY